MIFANRVPPKVRGSYVRDTSAALLGSVMTGLTIPFCAVIARKDLGASEFEIGIITMAPFGGLLLSLFWANIMEGRRKMPFASGGWMLARMILILTVFARTSHVFVGIYFAFWLISSVPVAAYAALMKEIYPDNDRGKIMGYVRVLAVLGTIAVTAIAGPLLHVASYRYVFPIAGIFGVASALVFRSIPTSQTSGDPETRLLDYTLSAVQVLRENHAYRWFLIGIFISQWANLMASPVYALYQVDSLHIDTRWASIFAVVSMGASTIAYYYWGHLMDRKRPVHLVAMNALLFGIVPLGFCIATKPWMLLPTMLLSGIVNAGLDLAYFAGVLHYAPHDRITQYQSIFATLVGIRGIMAPFMGAALVHQHILTMREVFLVAAALTFISYLVHLYAMRKYDFKPKAVDAH